MISFSPAFSPLAFVSGGTPPPPPPVPDMGFAGAVINKKKRQEIEAIIREEKAKEVAALRKEFNLDPEPPVEVPKPVKAARVVVELPPERTQAAADRVAKRLEKEAQQRKEEAFLLSLIL